MNRVAHAMAAAGLALAAAGCSDPGAPDSRAGFLSARADAVLTTDSSKYTATYLRGEGSSRTYGFRVVARFENRTRRTLYLQRCYPDSPGPVYSLRGVSQDAWGSAFNPVWACVGHDQQIEVPAGESRTHTLLLRGPNSFDRTGQHFGSLVGPMQIAYSVQGCRGDGECRLDDLVVSDPFTVELTD